MSAEFFLDTNILIYAFFDQDARKKARCRELHELALEDGRGIIRFQVVQEFLNTAIKKFPGQFTAGEPKVFLDTTLWPLCEIFPSQPLYQRALAVRSETGFSFYDSLIVAAALAGGCQTLYSEDLNSGQKIHGLEIKNPF